jgi:serine/threonine-protein kinase
MSAPIQTSHPGERLEELIERFELAWEEGGRPRLDDYLPADAGSEVLLELVLADLEYRLRSGDGVRVEEYLGRYPVLAENSVVALDLVVAEFRWRGRYEDSPSRQEYERRFPQWAAALLARFEEQSTQRFEQARRRTRPASTSPQGLTALKLQDAAEARIDFSPALSERYEILSEVARGGMGAVYRVRDQSLRRDLALKVLLPEHRGQAELERRFMQEAQIMGQLQHPGIAPVHELGRLGDGRVCFAMKLIQGRTLADLLAERTGLAENQARFLQLFEQVCQTLAYAHARGVIHRDLKPANIMVGAFGEVQIMDWGLAKVLTGSALDDESDSAGVFGTVAIRTVLTEGRADLSHAGLVIGTLAYMAPEQARGEHDQVDERVDVFGLGAILCVILTGKPPYSGETSQEVLASASAGDLAPAYLRLEQSGADSHLLQLARKCLAPASADRPRHAGRVAEEMSTYLLSVQTRLQSAELEAAAAEARATEARAKARAERRARHLTLGLGSLVVAIVLGLGGAALWWRQQRLELRHSVVDTLAEAEVQLRAEKWANARGLTERARGHLANWDPDGLRPRVDRIMADLDMITAMEAAFLEETGNKDDRNVAALDRALATAFRTYGLDVDALSAEEAASIIESSAIKEQLLATLNYWFFRNWTGRRGLVAVLDLTDRDESRRQVRAAVLDKNAAALPRVASQFDVSREPQASIVIMADALGLTGHPDLAVRILYQGQQRFPASFWINHDLGRYALQMEPPRPQEALGYLRAAVAVQPDSAFAIMHMGNALRDLRRPAEAEAAYRRALELQPQSAELHYSLCAALRDQKKTAPAEREARKALELKKDHALAHNTLGNLLRDQGKLSESEKELREAVRLRGDLPDVHYNLGLTLMGLCRLPEAEVELRRAVELRPRYDWAWYDLGNCLQQQVKLEEAAGAFRKAAELRPNFAEAVCNLGATLKLQGQLQASLEAYRRGHAIGSARPGWEYDSAEWVRISERLVALEAKLPGYLAGTYQPTGPQERIEIARMCACLGKHAEAVRFYVASFKELPAAKAEIGFEAAQAAARGAQTKPATEDSAYLRRLALVWLRADLRAHSPANVKDRKDTDPALHARLVMTHPAFSSLRDEQALAALPAEEREAWKELWADVDTMARSARDPD